MWGLVASVAAPYVAKGIASAFRKKPKANPYQQQLVNEATQQRATDRLRDQTAYEQSQQSRGRYNQAGESIASFDPTETAGWSSSTAGWKAGATGGLAPAGSTTGTAGALKGWKGRLADYKAPDLGTGAAGRTGKAFDALGAYIAGGGLNVEGQGMLDYSKLEDFDPTAAVKEYAGAAWSDTSTSLNEQLRDLRRQYAREGRTMTGYLEGDTGKTIRDVTRGYQNALATKALEAAGLRQRSISEAAGYRTQRAGDVDQFALGKGRLGLEGHEAYARAGTAADELEQRGRIRSAELDYESMSESDKNELARANNMDRNELDRTMEAERVATERARTMDTLDLQGREITDRNTLERARYVDDARLRARRESADVFGDIYRTDADVFDRASNRFRDMTASERDRAEAAKNARRARQQSGWQSAIGGIGTLADAWGTFRGGGYRRPATTSYDWV